MAQSKPIANPLASEIPTKEELLAELRRIGRNDIPRIDEELFQKVMDPKYDQRSLRSIARRYSFFDICLIERGIYR